MAEWSKVDFHQFINKFGIDFILEKAPRILYSKKDKEKEDYTSLIAFFFVASGLLIYISISIFTRIFYFSIIAFSIVIIAAIAVESMLIFYYIKSNVYIKPNECWFEIYKSADYYCFSFYPIFSGKSHPNKARDLIFKLYQEEVLKSTIDITQIELYLKIDKQKLEDWGGFFFQYGEGKIFNNENIYDNPWKFFPYQKSFNENYLAVANWEHQYEWKNDLALDYDKLNNYAPWIIKVWDKVSLKPLTDEFKNNNLEVRYIEFMPKLKPWEGSLETQQYENKYRNREPEIIDKAIEKIVGSDYEVKKLRDIEDDIFKFKAYFRDFNLES